jgi:hypothetical protein
MPALSLPHVPRQKHMGTNFDASPLAAKMDAALETLLIAYKLTNSKLAFSKQAT